MTPKPKIEVIKTIKQIDAILSEMVQSPREERGDVFWAEIDELLDTRWSMREPRL